jgi:NAD-dependent deacetylase
MARKKLVFFTGAGVSAESGLQTFRDSADGLWNNYHIEDVCTPDAWNRNPALVLEFYNHRREQCLKALPNEAHLLIAALEKDFDVVVVTQNVDDLHERAGSSHVIHLHGELMFSRSTLDPSLVYPCNAKIAMGDTCSKGSQLRPHIVWFGEMLDDSIMEQAIRQVMVADICVIIGSSMQVYPANGIPSYVKETCQLYIIDPDKVPHGLNYKGIHHIKTTAVLGMKDLVRLL